MDMTPLIKRNPPKVVWLKSVHYNQSYGSPKPNAEKKKGGGGGGGGGDDGGEIEFADVDRRALREAPVKKVKNS